MGKALNFICFLSTCPSLSLHVCLGPQKEDFKIIVSKEEQEIMLEFESRSRKGNWDWSREWPMDE